MKTGLINVRKIDGYKQMDGLLPELACDFSQVDAI
jgi:hypothetical protein